MTWTGTPKDWYSQTIGKSYNTDGAYGAQCWDYFDYFCRMIGCTASRYCANTGYVSDLWELKDKYGYSKWFEYIAPDKVQTGDWLIWKRGSKPCPKSHVGMLYDGETLGQNQGGKMYVTLKAISLSGIYGGFRWKGWKSMDISKFNDVELAIKVWNGEFGSGDERKKALGSRYKIVQELVDMGKSKLDDILDEPTDALKLVKLAQYQIGNKGDRYWDFIGEKNEWCSEFVAYTAYCLGFVKDGKMPKVNECWKAHDFYKAKGELHQKSGYYPKPGDVAYFGDKGLLHTSIVKSYDGKTLHTIDGNQYIDSQTWRTSIVKECSFNINDPYVWGFANPLTQGKTGWEYKDKKWYFYDNGVLVKGWKKIQWKQGNDWFWFDSNGVMVTGWRKINWSGKDRWFYFTQDGAMVTGLQYLEWQGKKDWYLFDQNGAMVTGKQKAEIVLNNSGQLTGGKKI